MDMYGSVPASRALQVRFLGDFTADFTFLLALLCFRLQVSVQSPTIARVLHYLCRHSKTLLLGVRHITLFSCQFLGLPG